jgi:hypothetical protein
MVQQDEHLNDLHEIRSMMERSSRFVSLSGLSGVFAGSFALLAALAVFLFQRDFFWGRYYNNGIFIREELLSRGDFTKFLIFILVVGTITLVLALSAGVIFTARNAKRKGLPYWDKSGKRMIINLFIPLITGGLFCLVLLYHKQIYLLAPATIIFYGLALINASKYICEIVLGLIASIFIGYGLVFWTIGFGILHIIYGSLMYFRYERFDNKSK